MEKLSAYIQSQDFWVGGLFVGILGNILAHWLVARFPTKYRALMSAISEKWKTRTTKLRQERESRIAPLVGNFQEQQVLLSLATAKRHTGTIGGLATFVAAVLTLVALTGLFVAIDNHKSVWQIITNSVYFAFFLGITGLGFHFSGEDFHNAQTMVDDVIQARKRQNLRVE